MLMHNSDHSLMCLIRPVMCAGVLDGRIVWGVDRQPKSLQRARANIMAGLGQLGMLTAQTCPKGLVHEVEHILQVCQHMSCQCYNADLCPFSY